MKIEKNVNNEELTIKLTGRLDTATAPELEAELNDVLTPASKLVMDFAELEYISSAGLRVLLKIQKTVNADGSMKLIHVSENVMEVFEITGFSDVLTVE